MALSDAKTRKM